MTGDELLKELRELAGNPKTDQELWEELKRLANNPRFMKNLKSMGKVMETKSPAPYKIDFNKDHVFLDEASELAADNERCEIKESLKKKRRDDEV